MVIVYAWLAQMDAVGAEWTKYSAVAGTPMHLVLSCSAEEL